MRVLHVCVCACMYLEKGVPLGHDVGEASDTVVIRGAIVLYTFRHLHLDLMISMSFII